MTSVIREWLPTWSCTGKKRRPRISNKQVQKLLEHFHVDCYPSHWQYAQLAEEIDAPLATVKRWFVNKRARDRKKTILKDKKEEKTKLVVKVCDFRRRKGGMHIVRTDEQNKAATRGRSERATKRVTVKKRHSGRHPSTLAPQSDFLSGKSVGLECKENAIFCHIPARSQAVNYAPKKRQKLSKKKRKDLKVSFNGNMYYYRNLPNEAQKMNSVRKCQSSSQSEYDRAVHTTLSAGSYGNMQSSRQANLPATNYTPAANGDRSPLSTVYCKCGYDYSQPLLIPFGSTSIDSGLDPSTERFLLSWFASIRACECVPTDLVNFSVAGQDVLLDSHGPVLDYSLKHPQTNKGTEQVVQDKPEDLSCSKVKN